MLDSKTQQIAGAVTLAIVLVAGFEGIRRTSYRDPVGIPTICYGHTQGVKLGQTKTQAKCDS